MKTVSKIVLTGAVMAVTGFAAGYYSAPHPIEIGELDNTLKKVCEYSASSLKADLQGGWPVNSFAVWKSGDRAHYHVLSQLGNLKCGFDPELTVVYLQNHGLVDIDDLKMLLEDSKKAGDNRLSDYLSAELEVR
ncbi:hypothetical protein NKJ09_08085 [Mesorhizobium sp. M0189]|uniref:hypothetical protein n=1 Tax=Mesorhizobium sp. M0189 TaxID=2956909 RepID=UPI003335E4AA